MSNKVLITKLLLYFNILLVLSDNIILPQIYKKFNFFYLFYINFIFLLSLEQYNFLLHLYEPIKLFD